MNVSLTPELEQLVKQKVAAGMYNSASEVMREALRLLEARDELRAVKLDALRRDIKQGIDELDQTGGDVLDIESIKAKARAIHKQLN